MTTVGIIGLGVMGSSIANHLIAAGTGIIVGYDLDPARLDTFVAAGGHACTSPAAVAVSADVVITSLPSVAAFESVVADLAGSGASGKIVDTSTLPLHTKETARQLLEKHGLILLDCPLSGTGAQARTGDVVVFISGDDATSRAVQPILESFSRSQHFLGEFGNGTRMKLIANHLVAVHNVAAAEALLLATRAGLDPATVLTAVSDGAGSSRMLEIRGPLMINQDFDDPSIRIDVFDKDLHIIDDFAQAALAPTPLFSAAAQIYRAALAQGRAAQDTAAVYAVLDQLATVAPTAREPE